MQVFTFPLNERGDAKLVVSVHNVPPMMGMPTPPTPALIHVPGGGFMACSESDTEVIGGKLSAKGVGVICTYLYPCARNYRFPQVVIDLMRSIKIVRDHAKEWSVDPKKIIISGNSAGAFICQSTGNLWNRPDLMEAAGCTGEEGKPDAMILGFGPMFCGQQVDDGKLTYVPNGDLVGDQTPPAFFHHARMDTLVSVYQAIAMIDAYERHKRPFGCFISGFGGHGETGGSSRMQGMDGTVGPCVDDWFDGCWNFLCNVLGLNQIPQKMMMMMGGPGAGGPGAGGPGAGGPGRPGPGGPGGPGSGGPGGGPGAGGPPMMMMNMPIPPEGSEPNGPDAMPFGQATEIHMPFNVGYKDKDFDTYK